MSAVRSVFARDLRTTWPLLLTWSALLMTRHGAELAALRSNGAAMTAAVPPAELAWFAAVLEHIVAAAIAAIVVLLDPVAANRAPWRTLPISGARLLAAKCVLPALLVVASAAAHTAITGFDDLDPLELLHATLATAASVSAGAACAVVSRSAGRCTARALAALAVIGVIAVCAHVAFAADQSLTWHTLWPQPIPPVVEATAAVAGAALVAFQFLTRHRLPAARMGFWTAVGLVGLLWVLTPRFAIG